MSVCESNSAVRRHSGPAIFCGALCFVCLLLFQPQGTAAQATSHLSEDQVAIGRLSGDDVSVKGAIGYETENGRSTALLASGSDLTLRSGEAKIDLLEGGDIILCGPAHLSILKSGAAITIALDYGQVHLQVDAAAQVTVYTPLLIITPVAIGTRETDLTVGLDSKGVLCIMALSGAMRIQEQFTGNNLIVPQGGDVQVDGGELRTLRGGAQTCSCELLVSRANPRQQIEAIPPAPAPPKAPSDVRAPQPIDSPTYRIEVPLSFDATAPAPGTGLTLQAVQLIRESVVEQPAPFRGAVTPSLPAPPEPVSSPVRRSHHSTFGFFARVFGIFHHHRSPTSQQSAAARA